MFPRLEQHVNLFESPNFQVHWVWSLLLVFLFDFSPIFPTILSTYLNIFGVLWEKLVELWEKHAELIYITLFIWDFQINLKLIPIDLVDMWTPAKSQIEFKPIWSQVPNLLVIRFEISFEPIWGYKLACERSWDLKSLLV